MVEPMLWAFTRLIEGQHITWWARFGRVHMGNGHAAEDANALGVRLWVLGATKLLATISPNLGVYVTEPDADSCRRLASRAANVLAPTPRPPN